jgi:glycosyltransferase involved in cell wall biosynthesis
MADLPAVLILTPIKDGAAFLPRYFELLAALDYPPEQLSLGFLVGNSTDNSHDEIAGRLQELRNHYRRVELFRHDFPTNFTGPRWLPEVQLPRRSTIAKARNWLLASSLRDEAWVMWLDIDLVDYPPELLKELLRSGKDVVTANCLHEHNDRSFDCNTYVITNRSRLVQAWWRWRYTAHGLFQPPFGVGRRYLDSCRGQDLVEVDGVGGTTLLVRASLHRQGLNFPAFALEGLIETEALALVARQMGSSCWGLPNLIVRHVNA